MTILKKKPYKFKFYKILIFLETSQDATNYKMRPGMDGAEVQDDTYNTDLNMNNGNVYSNHQVKGTGKNVIAHFLV